MVTRPQEAAGESTLDWSEFDEETIDCVLNLCYVRNYTVPWKRVKPRHRNIGSNTVNH